MQSEPNIISNDDKWNHHFFTSKSVRSVDIIHKLNYSNNFSKFWKFLRKIIYKNWYKYRTPNYVQNIDARKITQKAEISQKKLVYTVHNVKVMATKKRAKIGVCVLTRKELYVPKGRHVRWEFSEKNLGNFWEFDDYFFERSCENLWFCIILSFIIFNS